MLGPLYNRSRIAITVSNIVILHSLRDTVVLMLIEDKTEQIYRLFVPWLGRGLLIANGEKWFRSRRLLTPAFHFGVLKPYVQVYNECVQTLIVSVCVCACLCVYLCVCCDVMCTCFNVMHIHFLLESA